jgi:hypothetical protein
LGNFCRLPEAFHSSGRQADELCAVRIRPQPLCVLEFAGAA